MSIQDKWQYTCLKCGEPSPTMPYCHSCSKKIEKKIDLSGITNQALINSEVLKVELQRYKQEAEKIPDKCRHTGCLYEKDYSNWPSCDKGTTEWVEAQKKRCPSICPKYKSLPKAEE